MAAKKRQISIQFPLAGLNRKSALRQQAPYSTPDCLNVRAVTGIDGRERGGSRPGLIESHIDHLGGPIRLLTSMTLALGDGFTAWSDTFSGSSMAEAWSQASWSSAMPDILPSALAGINYDVAEGDAVADVIPIDTSKAYAVEVFLTPWTGAWHGSYRLYLRLDDTTPDIETDGVMVELTQTGTSGAYTGILRSVAAGVVTNYTITPGTLSAVRPGWLTATVTANTVAVYWNGVLLITQAVSAHTGKRCGFGLKCTVDGGVSLANVFRVQYYSTASVSSLRSMMIASAGGDLYHESFYGRLEEVTTDLTLRDGVTLTSAQSGQELYIADYGDVSATGTDGSVNGTAFDATGVADWTTKSIVKEDDVVVISNVTGTAVAGTYKIASVAAGSVTLQTSAGIGNCAYRIERAPKIYDPLTDTLSIWSATDGQVPTGCPIIWRYFDRLFLAGADIAPHVWYCSRKGNTHDFDYSQEDSQRAVAGPASEAGVPGDPITAGLAHSDDYSIIACRNSLWRLQGDPAFGGSLSNLSHTVGILGQKSWCLGPSGELIFLSLDGLYALPPGGASYPIPLSREALPREFLNINPDMVTASLEYDVQGRGVHIYLTSELSNSRIHWWMDWDRKTFWPLSLESDYEPTTTCAVQATAIEDSGVILGGRDGVLRRFSDFAENDCGTAFSSYVVIGPVAMAKDAQVGCLQAINADMAEGSGNVTLAIRPSLTFEGTVNAAESYSGVLTGGMNATVYATGRGQACTIKLTGAANRRWAVEQITAVVREAGTRRIS